MGVSGKRRGGIPKRRWVEIINDNLTEKGLLSRVARQGCLEAMIRYIDPTRKRNKIQMKTILESHGLNMQCAGEIQLTCLLQSLENLNTVN